MRLAGIINFAGAFIASNLKESSEKSLCQSLNVNYTQKLELGVSGLNIILSLEHFVLGIKY